MAEIKPISKIAAKWAANAGSTQAGASYLDGVQNPRRPWEASTLAGAGSYRDGILESIRLGSFETGVSKAGELKWAKKSASLGPTRYRQGVADAEPEYLAGFTPFHAVIAGVVLPPRGPKGSPENLLRVAAIANALHEAKIAGA